ncbi:11156_t:CDS:2, partial [Gigaspora rosea]
DDLYEYLKVELTKCLLDKEAGGDDNHGKYVIEKFIGMLHNDPSVEVRCAVIYNIEYNEETLAYILQRAHRSNKSSKCFYENAEEINDFHVLSIEDREKLLSWGLTGPSCEKSMHKNTLNELDLTCEQQFVGVA